MNKKTMRFGIGVFVFLFIMFMVIFSLNLNVKENKDYYFDNYSIKIKNKLAGILNGQKEADKRLSSIYESSEYTIDHPYIEVNPYIISPLSAIVIFKTEKEEEVDIYLNDVHLTKMDKNVRHAVPLYGLCNSGVNILKLVTKTKEVEHEIRVNSYNYDISDFDLASLADKKGTTLLVGDLNKHTSNIRGFDENNNLNFYLDLDYIGAFKDGDKLNVGYNSKMGLKLLNLEIDYLGKISTIKSDTSNLISKSNISLNGEYIFKPVKYYKKKTSNYEFINYKYLEDVTENERVYTNDFKKELVNAKEYKKELSVSYVGDYLIWDNLPFEKLILVNSKDANSRIYNIENLNMIKIERDDKYIALYAVNKNGEYFKLNREIKLD